MGQFSWLDCRYNDREHNILDDVCRTSYVLVPKEFERQYGKRIEEKCYDGYGRFGGYDIYELVAIWNKDHIGIENIKVPKRSNFEPNSEYYRNAIKYYQKKCERMEDFIFGLPFEEMDKKYGTDYNPREWLRLIGIDIACYNEDNERLEYPIKITYDKTAVYEDCKPSKSDPNQGWRN